MSEPTPATPPAASRRPHRETRHGQTVEDPYHWLRERHDPEVLAHLKAENAYAEQLLAPLADLRDRLFDEIRGRVQETDASAPVADGGWLYYYRTLAGQQYPIHCRRPRVAGGAEPAQPASTHRADRTAAQGGEQARRDSNSRRGEEAREPVDAADPPADEQILLDENAEAGEHEFFRVGGLVASPDHDRLAYLADTTGGEVFTIRVRDLRTGRDHEDAVHPAGYGLAWYDDGRHFLYTVPDEAWRPHQVWRHRLGTDPGEDELVLEEADERLWLGVGRLRSDAFLVISARSTVTSEAHLLPADDPEATPRLVAAREHGVEYDVDHRGDLLYLTTNADGAHDFKLVTAPVDTPGRHAWTDLVGHRPGIRLEGADCFADHLVLSERTRARTQLRVVDPDTGTGSVLPTDEEVCTTAVGPNPAFAIRTLRIGYTSLTTPPSVIDVDLDRGDRHLVKRQPVRGGYAPADYVGERRWATAADGTRIPVSLVRRRTTPLDGTAPCLLYGYGAYEISVDPAFSSSRLSLLDRGAVFAIAHVRGGGELGRRWYEEGKLAAKPNTFGDFVACADHLVETGVTSRERLAVRGGSAGGLLIGAALNLRPDLAAAAVAEVPFVDVANTMSDPTLPLTVIEYDEWGDPGKPDAYAVIRAYAPYDNVRPAAYPALLVTAGLSDPRVQYWEPAKWVARLRDVATGGGPILLRTRLGAGHAGRSGRYEAWRDEAEVLAFVIDRLGAPHAPITPAPAAD